MIDLSIIIVNFNNKKLLEECLYSIYASTHKVSFEIIVVDNHSSDGSAQLVKNSFPQVTLIENQQNLGFSQANNQGLTIGRGRYAMLLNNDTIVKDQAFDQLVDFMDISVDIGACGPKLLNLDGTIQHQGGLLSKKFWRSNKPVAVSFLIGACLMVRREVLERVGLMDEKLFFYNDDLDWCLRIRKAGWKIYFFPQATVVHYGGASSHKTFNRRLFVEGFKGGLYFTRKHYGELVYQVYRTLLVLFTIPILPFMLRNREKLNAYVEILLMAALSTVPKP